MNFIKQHKGKALEKITEKARLVGDYFLSIKRDGQMIQIAYDGDQTVKFWSSNGHPFYNQNLAKQIIEFSDWAFHVEAEYTGTSEGKMGDRGKSSKITTYRTDFSKGMISKGDIEERCWVFDILSFDGKDVRQDPFEDRIGCLNQIGYSTSILPIFQDAGCTIEDGLRELDQAIAAGYEGIILTHATHVIGTSGRSNLRAKLKEMPTDYGVIVGYTPGTKEREGTIGSLTVRDDSGFEFSAGTGLNANEWSLDPETLLGIRVKFGYESIKDGVYQQPRYLGAVLEDKSLVRLNEMLSLNTYLASGEIKNED